MAVIVNETINAISTQSLSDSISSISTQKVLSDSSLFDNNSVFDCTTYNCLSRLEEMKTLVYPDRVKSEFDLYIKYAEEKTNGVVHNNGFDLFDNYLGSIGVSDGIC